MVKMPFFFTSAVATSARLAITLAATAFFSSHFVARASAMAPLVMAVAAFFIMGAMASKMFGAKTFQGTCVMYNIKQGWGMIVPDNAE